jgi:hypothetical protein
MRDIGPVVAIPALFAAPPGRHRDLVLELAHLEGQLAVGIEGKRRAVEDEFVLAAKLVGVEDRQVAFDHLADDHLVADVDLAAIIGRTVRHQQHFRAAFGQRLADAEIAPDILADRNAEPDAAKIDRARHRTLVENALLVELAVIGQVDLVALGGHLAAVEHHHRIVPLVAARQRHAHDDARPAIGGFGGQLLHRLLAGGRKAGFMTRSSGG